jgi:RNA polymerase sigma-70 factor (sigma-E family)
VDSTAETEFTEFAAARWSRLVRTAYMLTGDHHEAEDLVQATLTKLYASWHRVRRADDPDAYTRRALTYHHISCHRRRRVAHVLVPFLPETGDRGEAERPENRSALMSALAALPPRQRAAVVLRYWEDLSEQETAAALGCSVGTVRKMRNHPALVQLAPATT